jgi:SulP family sulfate permease
VGLSNQRSIRGKWYIISARIPKPRRFPWDKPYFRQLAGEFQPKRLFPSLVAGLISGILTVIIEISLAALIFSGDLARFVSNGIGITLFSSLVIGVVVALTSSLRGTVAVGQDIPAAILAPVAAGIATSLTPSGSPEATYATVVAVMAVTSLVTGIGFLLMGIFRLGGLIRFIPYPVIGGFLAGTGWLLVKGSFGVMANASLTLIRAAAFVPGWCRGQVAAWPVVCHSALCGCAPL